MAKVGDFINEDVVLLALGVGGLYVLYKSGFLQNISSGIGMGVNDIGAGVGDIGLGLGSGLANIGNGVNNLGVGLGSGLAGIGNGLGNLATGIGNTGLQVTPQGQVNIGLGANTPTSITQSKSSSSVVAPQSTQPTVSQPRGSQSVLQTPATTVSAPSNPSLSNVVNTVSSVALGLTGNFIPAAATGFATGAVQTVSKDIGNAFKSVYNVGNSIVGGISKLL